MLGECYNALRMNHLVGDGGRPGTNFKAFWWQVPVGACSLTSQLHAGNLIILYNFAQPKVLQGSLHHS